MSTLSSSSRVRTTAPTTPTTSRVASTHATQASPHYSTTRRHSLYGVEDRVIIDPGSRIWKVGFSGEGRPREVLYAGGKSGTALWGLERAVNPADRAEENKLLSINLERCLRSVFHDSLLTDPKARKVILVEHPLLPLYIKDVIAQILFDNLQVPSISFASSHLLSLLTVGRITGLVIDCGHLESVALPIFAARPMFPQLRTTPLAGARLSSHLRALILLFGTYLPPPTTLSAAGNIPASSRATRVPQEVLTDTVIEEIKTRCCFVGEALGMADEHRGATPIGDLQSDIDIPPSETTESDFSFTSGEGASSQVDSDFSVVSTPRAPISDDRARSGENYLGVLAAMYKRTSTATDLTMRVVPPVSQQTGTGHGTLVIPGWIRERSAEVIFEGGDVDESSVAETILDSLLKAPVDLRKTLASSILVVGGTSMLPGFIPRLHSEILRALAPLPTSTRQPIRPDKPLPPQYDRYAALRPLTSHFAILNNPFPQTAQMSTRARLNAGKAPAFTPATMAWVGGSLAGSLKTGGVELTRERWDEAASGGDDDMNVDTSVTVGRSGILPDWTRIPLSQGAPPASSAVHGATHTSPSQARVGA
ncbi:actin family [Armillaria novae-zelandiae]|uniref:Actin family n=1 Tax=Armillaria novae-zelandiae TaxID=153914 RepID=A0AA39PA73_9AGAR|nr:actin family [Armillaria novae-zelandiae]